MSLLRYCGGKSKKTHEITPHIIVPKGGTYCEPFVGGGSVGLAVAQRDPYIRIILNDLHAGVAAFWGIVSGRNKSDFTELRRLIAECLPSPELFDEYQQWEPDNPVEQAYKFFVLNRTCHVTSQGKRKLSEIDSRWNPYRSLNELDEAREVLRGRTVVYNKDFADVIKDADETWTFYLDPPYYRVGNKLYVDFQMAEEKHVQLRDMLRATLADWVLSYDKHSRIAELYGDFTVAHPMQISYSATPRKRRDTELIIVPIRPSHRGDQHSGEDGLLAG